MKPLKLGEYPDGKTNYQIIDEFDEKTTITLDKWVDSETITFINSYHHELSRSS